MPTFQTQHWNALDSMLLPISEGLRQALGPKSTPSLSGQTRKQTTAQCWDVNCCPVCGNTWHIREEITSRLQV